MSQMFPETPIGNHAANAVKTAVMHGRTRIRPFENIEIKDSIAGINNVLRLILLV
jgi:hypothetical protein